MGGDDPLDITSSIPDILDAADSLRSQGENLTNSVNSALAAIDNLDVPAMFPPDRFTDEFLRTYHKQVDAGEDGAMPANAAVKHQAGQLGAGLTAVADFVTNAMLNYQRADEQGAAEIKEASGNGTASARRITTGT
ncbi:MULTISPECIES: hypothetical protein [Protofrankia]|uniref:ESX-1 secretion-associated protein n=1 Tax=Protofrankia coriariae TaxID=1562887 RepID=A0ABR5EZ96_9ACTN|nr:MULTISPECIES: hypothetical protein [Protofrankia]KLL09776.1 hypothetical protein FrCorBMG51_22525 [Protofrankia coriariae]ONH32210.1 hypothetical protein BL254_22090 [Protofrankia sp. BMG5.30]